MGLFSEFDGITPEVWLEKIITDLKGADFEREVVWASPEGIRIEPFYHDRLTTDTNRPILFRKNHAWQIVGSILVDDPALANAKALELLNEGYEALCFDMNRHDLDQAAFDALVKDILLDVAPVQCSNYKGTPDLNSETLALSHVCSVRDFITDDFWQGEQNRVNFKSGWNGSQICPVRCINTVPYKNAGANIVSELAFTLALVQEYLHELGDCSGLKAIYLNMAVSGNFFFELAKLRAVRQLLPMVTRKYKTSPIKLIIQSEVSSDHMESETAYNNLIRSTIAAMAAVLGGTDRLYLAPYTDEPSKQEAAKRWAKNISLLLRHESGMDHILDPANGAYYMEHLTNELCRNGWESFINLEGKGGFWAAAEQGLIRTQIETDVQKRDSSN